ncbi:ABC transporter permease [Solimonas sp. K1W22B-7]|uniref:ABC transporter permease n=1 Tax=Solimonas sp. K1W22B-7 TaxID=2303331 RepID=UPI000E33280D|nr:ABC transporter permease [Solimonas sp. K1W22B-7]AXQ30605.1 ABC transporter permease [Solimonas sp. K1W22B-7]
MNRYQIADRRPFQLSALLRRWESLLLLLFFGVFLGSGLLLPNFLDPYNLADSTFNFSEKALIALPIALLIICREIDLSVAATMALASLAMGLANVAGMPAGVLALVGIGVGAACGLVNGVLVTGLGIPSIVVTIGTMALFRGIASVALGDKAITQYPEALADWGQGYAFGMIPLEFLVLVVAAIAFALLLHATAFGRELYAIGHNPVAARMTGVPVARYRFLLFVLTGAMAGLAAVLLTGRIGSTRPNIALGWELEAITMAILGGVSIAGGTGTIAGVMLAALTLGTLTYALGMANVPGIIMTILVGGLLLATITLPVLLRQRDGSRN